MNFFVKKFFRNFFLAVFFSEKFSEKKFKKNPDPVDFFSKIFPNCQQR